MPLLKLLPPAWKEWLQRRAGAVTPEFRLKNLRQAGFHPKYVIDAGAFHGEWTQRASRIFPEAAFLLIEPQPELQKRLEELCRKIPRTFFYKALLGSDEKPIYFLLENSNSRIVPSGYVPAQGQELIKLGIERLEDIARKTGFESCDMLKLDLQGHEVEALAGAGALFGKIEVIFIEVSWLRIGPVPIVSEIIDLFSGKGYRLYDVLGFNYRPLDRALWQTDFIFVRSDSALLSSREWA